MIIRLFDSKIEKFIESLEPAVAAKTLRTIDLLETFGNQLGLPHSKKIGDHLFELRVRGKEEVRIIYTFHGGGAVLLHGFIKKSRRIPPKVMALARQKLGTLDEA
ncbi:MAG: type II toxin-antitoxin system RelE/ParE family toxin [Candidatus Sungbacteria bacterium]|nr:type II toxin-antitoxin system RelE/ParE family toxin [Candidatus Sungbacteria bacterium]